MKSTVSQALAKALKRVEEERLVLKYLGEFRSEK